MAGLIHPPHHFAVRVYYEDTDLAGVVYYANYFRFMERGRTELLRAAGVEQSKLKAESGHVFVVRRVESDFLGSAVFDDLLTVETGITRLAGASVTMSQRILRGRELLNDAVVLIACLGPDGRPARIPPAVKGALSGPVA
jgi:acyl-CoA thioester hydrolase